jgi:hypothetical protein
VLFYSCGLWAMVSELLEQTLNLAEVPVEAVPMFETRELRTSQGNQGLEFVVTIAVMACTSSVYYRAETHS